MIVCNLHSLKVEGVGPLQQGLRPVVVGEYKPADGVEGVGPLQQGLRPIPGIYAKLFLAFVEGVGPLQQGLRLEL